MRLGIGFTKNDGLPQVPITRIWDFGAHWGAVHKGPTEFDWSPLDRAVSAAESMGAQEIIYVMWGTPVWSARNPHTTDAAPWLGAGSNSVPSNLRDWAAFVTHTAARYKGRITAYEIGNEPQLSDFMTHSEFVSFGPSVLATMTNIAARKIKKIDPKAKIVGASVLPRRSSGGMHKANHVLKAFKNKHTDKLLDAYAIHLYPQHSKGESFDTLLKSCRAGFRQSGVLPRPLWVTEAMPYLLEGDAPVTEINHAYMAASKHSGGDFAVKEWLWYAWQHADLQGAYFGPNSPAWTRAQSLTR